MRIVLDTNILISAFVSKRGASAQILAYCQSGELELLSSPDTLDELRCVLAYPDIRKRLTYRDEQIEGLLAFLELTAVSLTPSSILRAVPADAEDDKFVALALAGEARYIVSGDGHLLELGEVQGVSILKPAEFLRRWQTLRPPPVDE